MTQNPPKIRTSYSIEVPEKFTPQNFSHYVLAYPNIQAINPWEISNPIVEAVNQKGGIEGADQLGIQHYIWCVQNNIGDLTQKTVRNKWFGIISSLQSLYGIGFLEQQQPYLSNDKEQMHFGECIVMQDNHKAHDLNNENSDFNWLFYDGKIWKSFGEVATVEDTQSIDIEYGAIAQIPPAIHAIAPEISIQNEQARDALFATITPRQSFLPLQDEFFTSKIVPFAFQSKNGLADILSVDDAEAGQLFSIYVSDETAKITLANHEGFKSNLKKIKEYRQWLLTNEYLLPDIREIKKNYTNWAQKYAQELFKLQQVIEYQKQYVSFFPVDISQVHSISDLENCNTQDSKRLEKESAKGQALKKLSPINEAVSIACINWSVENIEHLIHIEEIAQRFGFSVSSFLGRISQKKVSQQLEVFKTIASNADILFNFSNTILYRNDFTKAANAATDITNLTVRLNIVLSIGQRIKEYIDEHNSLRFIREKDEPLMTFYYRSTQLAQYIASAESVAYPATHKLKKTDYIETPADKNMNMNKNVKKYSDLSQSLSQIFNLYIPENGFATVQEWEDFWENIEASYKEIERLKSDLAEKYKTWLEANHITIPAGNEDLRAVNTLENLESFEGSLRESFKESRPSVDMTQVQNIFICLQDALKGEGINNPQALQTIFQSKLETMQMAAGVKKT